MTDTHVIGAIGSAITRKKESLSRLLSREMGSEARAPFAVASLLYGQ